MLFPRKVDSIKVLLILTILILFHTIVSKGVRCETHEAEKANSNELQYRIFQDELYLLQNQNKLASKDIFRSNIPWLTFEKNLETKRKSYDLSFVAFLEKYHICPNNLYNKLDYLWDESKDIARKNFNIYLSIMPPNNMQGLFEGWDNYLQGTNQLALQLAKDKLQHIR